MITDHFDCVARNADGGVGDLGLGESSFDDVEALEEAGPVAASVSPVS